MLFILVMAKLNFQHHYSSLHNKYFFIIIIIAENSLSGFCHFGLVSFMSFLTEPPVIVMFLCECAASSVLEPCALSPACLVSCFRFRVVVRTLALHVLSCCVSVRTWIRSAVRSSVHVCFVVLNAVCLFFGCMHSCYVLCCVARSLCI